VILAFLAAAAAQGSAVDAEREFAARAQTHGQWTAFREYAAADGLMFVPEQVNAQQWLKDRSDPPQAVMWWPAEAYISCDGTVAATTGPWVRNGGKLAGYFTTIWKKQPDGGWKWVLDHGDVLAKPRASGDTVKLRRPDCSRPQQLPPPMATRGNKIFSGGSPDQTLLWVVSVAPDGGREVNVLLGNGPSYHRVIEDKVGPPK